jgi:predicted DNA-binding protein YlxM (UPF0122 family)
VLTEKGDLEMETVDEVSLQQTRANSSRRSSEIDLLRSRLNLLDGRDRVMMAMYVENGNSFRQIARLLGVKDGIISRRIRRLQKGLIDSEYITCLRWRRKFTPHQMTIAKDHFLLGISRRRIAVKRRLSLYHVRNTIETIQQILDKDRGD